jgi:EVE domain
MIRYWIGVVSHEHVLRGVEGGFAQVCHGKAAPLKRMKQGDWLIYYSPREGMMEGAPIQAFTAIGQLRDNETYAYQMTETFCPYRRKVDYRASRNAEIRPMLDQLTFIKDKQRWGAAFRFGHLEIPVPDFEIIATAMGVEP